LPTGMEFHDDGVSPHKAAELGDAVENIRRMILRLPESQRAVIQLRDIEGLSYQEVADALDLSMEQVKVYLHRARKTIREQIIQNEKYGIENH
ncbi:MAG TPA: RNA polymerase sigma factor, partial [Saprospiraceae bacterium]|nr:RNA polymerase sigma factor [Saprospiraceae bacterium]